jgi:hypothetical protein
VVDLVLDAASLESLALHRAACVLDRDPGRPADVRRQVGDRQATLARHLAALRADYAGVRQHQQAIRGLGLGMLAHVHGHHTHQLPELRGGQPDAAWEGAHRVHHVPADPLDLLRLGRRGDLLQRRMRIEEYLSDAHRNRDRTRMAV